MLLAHSVPVDGQCLCALALIADAAAGWDAEITATAHAVAAIVATQIRHANDMTALAERQTLTRALIAGAPIAVLAMDAEGCLIEFNPAAEKLSGYRRDDVLGRPCPRSSSRSGTGPASPSTSGPTWRPATRRSSPGSSGCRRCTRMAPSGSPS